MHIAPLSPDDPAELGGYELLGRIGQGGMGQVYLGESPGGEPAAVKVIKPSVVDYETRLRFAQEVEILKTVWGARIAALLDADPEADPPWLATEYVEGLDLSRHVGSHGPLDALLTASLGATLAEALATVHKQGLLHAAADGRRGLAVAGDGSVLVAPGTRHRAVLQPCKLRTEARHALVHICLNPVEALADGAISLSARERSDRPRTGSSCSSTNATRKSRTVAANGSISSRLALSP
ncbi:protein kinase [Streptomyces sp. NPDC102283]|uniref:protein kinase domain-containing protein n=1 Tax=Streptomyces sp. NPDC102283 TaxID=3366155 RepID=UPI0038148FA0